MDELDFNVTELSAAISNLPTRIGNPSDAELFRNIPGTTNVFSMEFYEESGILVPTTEWGGVAPKNSSGKRTAKSWTIPHMPLEDVVKASDVIGVRAFGSTAAETVQGKVLDKLQAMKNKIDATLAYRRSKAKQGIIVDADGSTILNYFTEFGIAEQVVYFDLGTATTNIAAKCQDVIDQIEDGLGQEVYSSIEVEVDRAFYDALTAHKNVREVYLGWSAAEAKLGRSNTSGFEFGGLKFIVNRQKVGATPLVAASTGHAYPRGTQDVFLNGLAPADFNETVNTLALPYYAKQAGKQFDRGFDLHVQSNQLPIVAKPKALVKVSAAASAG
ncbi:major capsid protein [Acinetobacter pragensis]|uniref:major capsid protein n=1 Tax=Acinetobacter pragensis TaxID=1806892 RepID=UPI00333F6648